MPRVLDPFRFVVIAVAGWMNQRQLLVIEYLREESTRSAYRSCASWLAAHRRKLLRNGAYIFGPPGSGLEIRLCTVMTRFPYCVLASGGLNARCRFGPSFTPAQPIVIFAVSWQGY